MREEKKIAFETYPGPGLNPVEPLVRHCYVFLARDKYIYLYINHSNKTTGKNTYFGLRAVDQTLYLSLSTKLNLPWLNMAHSRHSTLHK